MRIGKYDIKILRIIEKLDGEYFNLSRFSRQLNTSKGTIHPAIQRLKANHLIKQRDRGSYIILKEGISIIDRFSNEYNTRRVVRSKKLKSIHNINIKIETEIKDRDYLVNRLEPVKMFKSYPKNWTQYNLEMDDGTKITLKPNITILHFQEVTGKDYQDADKQVTDKVFHWINKFKELDIKTHNVYVDYSHFAKINSEFAKIIEDRVGRYEHKTKDGSFWIDYSTGEIEEETDDIQLREALDVFMEDLKEGKQLGDVSKRMERAEYMLTQIVQLEKYKLQQSLNTIAPENTINHIKEYTG